MNLLPADGAQGLPGVELYARAPAHARAVVDFYDNGRTASAVWTVN